ncbi:L-fucose dehydrogenase-like [Anticarsia gemmatalis]|uniref:L-fucose dehydrogenase-like n=1 Tax=Anticarsia gemmatalis TaxID=129554 RepID=UPI003F76B384
MSFQGKVVLVTGASSGIGAAIAIKFAEEGAQVSLVGRNQEKLNNVAKKCGNPLILVADVTKEVDAKRIVDETVRYFGQLDVLVNNAGIGLTVKISQPNALEIFDKVMATNIRAPVMITNLAVPHLIKTKGNIINISSIAATRVISEQSFSYCTSKAALDHFTKATALELASSGVRANTVNPGPVYTDIIENMGASGPQVEAAFEHMKGLTALNRVSDPEEVADVVLFLASDKAKGITGSSYVTDNGTTLKH